MSQHDIGAKAEDVFEYELDSKPVSSNPRSCLERFIHSEIYKARRDVKAVVHNHSPALVPFRISKVPLRPVYHMASFVGEGVPVFEIRNVASESNMLVNDAARAVYLELNAKLQAQAMGLGGPLTYLSAEESKLATQDYERSWNLWKLRVGGK